MSYPPSTVTDPTDSDDTCPGCGNAHAVQPQPAAPTVEAWTCTACGLHWATTVANPAVRVALSIVGLLPQSQRRAALLAVLRTEVIRRSERTPPW
jgi:ribosomal protein L37AE/L43A